MAFRRNTYPVAIALAVMVSLACGGKKKKKDSSDDETPAVAPVSGAQPDAAAGTSGGVTPIVGEGGQPAAAEAAIETLAAGINLDIGHIVPYELVDVTVYADQASGGGIFSSSLQCMTIVGADHACNGLAQTQFTAAMAKDTFGATEPTYDECVAIAGGANSVSAASDIAQADGHAKLTSGGIVVNPLGPAPLCDASNGVLVFAVKGASGCKWWRIAVSCL